MSPRKTISRLLLISSVFAVLAFAVSAVGAQDDTTTQSQRPGRPEWQAPPEGSTPPELPEGVTPPERPEGVEPPVDGELPPRPPHWNYTTTTTVTCAPATRLEGETQGEVAQSYSSIRESIGSSTVLATMPGGAVFEILDGPVCSGPHYWYQVSYNGVVGWVAEGNLTEYWLEPTYID